MPKGTHSGIERQPIAHEVCAGEAIEVVEVGLTICVREGHEKKRRS